MKPTVVVHYQLKSLMGPRTVTYRYDTVGTGFRVPAVNEHLQADGRLYCVARVTWNLNSPSVQQEVTVTADEVGL
ncbi:hypothetical protein AU099_gp47 [Gordonia phage GTE8]|uniref:Uncharacterized protein n=1 Tax=Gordonia phage GTE8 TaxID=1647475 RepID=A0A0K0N6E7_9CAUD|nr:hypothetical protein AU099_gp47 [Gordonia phage GTE8]AKJ72390.1 hypothetical protein GTE8_47 [Gordonia phage GTE8]